MKTRFISLCILGLALYFLFLFTAPDMVIRPLMYGVAGWQVGQWITQLAIKLSFKEQVK